MQFRPVYHPSHSAVSLFELLHFNTPILQTIFKVIHTCVQGNLNGIPLLENDQKTVFPSYSGMNHLNHTHFITKHESDQITSSSQGGQSGLSKSKTNAVGIWACCDLLLDNRMEFRLHQSHVPKKYVKVMSLLVDLRMKFVTHRWAITGKNICLHPVKRKLSKSVFSQQGVLFFHWLLSGNIEVTVGIIKQLALPIIC